MWSSRTSSGASFLNEAKGSSIEPHSTLFAPLDLAGLAVPNRIAMAPMVRGRANPLTNFPTGAMAQYYAQRTGAGLIIAEATAVSPGGRNYHGCAGIYTDVQTAGWRDVADRTHARGGRIFLQLLHAGRATHTSVVGGQPVGPSAIACGTKTYTSQGFSLCSEPRALEVAEIVEIVEDYAVAAYRSRQAGFDGVEIHAANGYLIDQFLKDGSNRRQDAYGGAAANRCRLLREVVDAVLAAWPHGRVGVRLSPGPA
jgi:N-ethylmaleimide reductase